MRIEKSHRRLARALPVVLGLIALAACGTSRDATRGQAARSAEPETVAIDTSTVTATVKSIDYAKRTLTVDNANGLSRTYEVSKNVVNFDQIHKGDTVRATVTEALAVSIRKGIPPNVSNAFTVSLAPKGTKPAMFVTNTDQVIGKITSIDGANRSIRIKELFGPEKTLKLAPMLEISNLKMGDFVVVRYTKALALYLEKS